MSGPTARFSSKKKAQAAEEAWGTATLWYEKEASLPQQVRTFLADFDLGKHPDLSDGVYAYYVKDDDTEFEGVVSDEEYDRLVAEGYV